MTNDQSLDCFKDDDVISFESDGSFSYKIKKLREMLSGILESKDSQICGAIDYKLRQRGVCFTKEQRGFQGEIWFTEGVECELLQLGASQWQKGKLKLKLVAVFEPDEAVGTDAHMAQSSTSSAEPSLDDIRNTIESSTLQ